MKKLLIMIVLLFTLPIRTGVALPIGVYAGVKGGMGITNKNTKTTNNIAINPESKDGSPFVSVDVGVRLLDFRFELEYTYIHNLSKVEISSTSKNITAENKMANIYYNFYGLPLVKFYVNGGVGTTNFSGKNKSNNNFAWNLGLGINLSLLNIINIDVGYRYVDMGELQIEGGPKMNQSSNDVYVGLRFGF
jgi:opacity protein-like surface antigen